MEAAKSRAEAALEIRRSFAAPRGIVFRAWTHPEALKEWMAPNDAFAVPLAEVDLRQGGRYRIEMKSPEGHVHTVVGTYRRQERILFMTKRVAPRPAAGVRKAFGCRAAA